MPSFHFTQPEFTRQVLELPNGTFSVGRSSRNQIILEDPSVSKEHAELLIHGTEVILRDRGSQNGSFVDGVRVQPQSGVRHGQRIRFGRVELLVDLGEPQAEDATDITAVSILRTLSDRNAEAEATSVRFPLRFTPVTGSSGGPSTGSLPHPESAAPPPVPVPQTPTEASRRPWSARIRGLLGKGNLFLLVPWLWKL